MSAAPRLSVVIPTYRRPELLARCLAAALTQSIDRQAYEVIPPVRPAWLDVFNRIKQVSGDLEIAPGLQLVELPGHTTGLQGMRVATRQGTILLASDAIPLVENWEGDQDLPHIPNGIHVDLRLYDWTFHRMEQFGDRVLPSHDVRIFDQRQYG